jgi:hypothetical protein
MYNVVTSSPQSLLLRGIEGDVAERNLGEVEVMLPLNKGGLAKIETWMTRIWGMVRTKLEKLTGKKFLGSLAMRPRNSLGHQH